MLDDMQKWMAFKDNDKSFDGLFFACVKTTKIFCRPSCRAKTPKRENVLFSDTAQEARQRGFRPCKICRPDQIEYDPQKELAGEIRRHIAQSDISQKDILPDPKEIGVSKSRMQAVFKQVYGMTVFAYKNSLRIEHAKAQLLKTEDKVCDIALASGFMSLSCFYTAFQKGAGMPPQEYRKRMQKR